MHVTLLLHSSQHVSRKMDLYELRPVEMRPTKGMETCTRMPQSGPIAENTVWKLRLLDLYVLGCDLRGADWLPNPSLFERFEAFKLSGRICSRLPTISRPKVLCNGQRGKLQVIAS